MAVNISTPAPQHSGGPRPHPAHSHIVSAVWLFILIALTGLVTGLIIAMAFFGVLDLLARASH
jgi:hypothetical protein